VIDLDQDDDPSGTMTSLFIVALLAVLLGIAGIALSAWALFA